MRKLMTSRLARLFLLACPIALMILLTPRTSAAQDLLSTAHDMYAAAAYEDALAVLDRLASGNAQTDRFAVNQYRAFCLLALGRTSEADRAIEAVVSDRPLYHPSEAEASPRLRSAFTTVRQRMLPAIVQQKYAVAKAAFDQKDFAGAEAAFRQVIDTLTDPDLGPAATRPPLSDLGTLAAGFRDLSARAVAVALDAAKAPVVKEPPQALPTPAVAQVRHIVNAAEPNVVPPVAIRQDFPPYPRDVGTLVQGGVEIVIDETGMVESAVIRGSMNPRYDQIVLVATRNWRYKPATLNGVPVKFRKLIGISVKPGI